MIRKFVYSVKLTKACKPEDLATVLNFLSQHLQVKATANNAFNIAVNSLATYVAKKYPEFTVNDRIQAMSILGYRDEYKQELKKKRAEDIKKEKVLVVDKKVDLADVHDEDITRLEELLKNEIKEP